MSDHKVNLQARIKRHSRILKDNLWNSLHYSKTNTTWYKIVAIFLILLFPIYPAFSYFWTTAESFYRWNVDESSILESYDVDQRMVDSLADTTLFESKDSFLSIWTLVEDDNSISNTMIEYDIIKWDTLELIAKKYNVSQNTILWANPSINTKTKKLTPWTKLIFPPITWVVYSVKSWDSISWIAHKYHVYTKDIVRQNNIKNNYLKISQQLIIPNWKYIKEEVKKKAIYWKNPYYNKTYKSKTSYMAKASNTKWLYSLKYRKPYSWAWWNCTWYVASYKKVNWRWNANQWLKNARARWNSTGSEARNGAIVVLWWRWYNRWYGHVAIVRRIEKNHLIISDMNYRKLGQMTIRKIKRYWGHIKWYIYVWD